MRKICIIGPLPPPIGGDAKALKTLIDSNKFKEEFKPKIINISDGKLRSSGKKNVTISKVKKIINVISKLKEYSSQNSVDTYYLTIAQSKFGSLRDIAILKTIFKYKTNNSQVIIHLHGGGFRKHLDKTPDMLKKLIVKYYSQADKGIVLSKSLINMFEGVLDEDKISVVQNCVDDQFLISDEEVNEKMLAIEHKKKINVIYLSNMIKSKGYYDLIVAAKMMKEENNKFNFIFAGPFPNEKDKIDFKDFIKSNNLQDCVEYLGAIEGLTKYKLLVKGNIFVLPTYFPPEGQPISILESMGAAMPVITTNQGGILDIVEDKKNGFIIPSQNPIRIKESLLNLTKDVELFKSIAMRNRLKVITEHTEENHISQMLKTLK